MSMMDELGGSVWVREAKRLIEHWREMAQQLQPYAPGASAAYLRAGEELEVRLNGSGTVAASIETLCGQVRAATREAVREEIAEHRKRMEMAKATPQEEAGAANGGAP